MVDTNITIDISHPVLLVDNDTDLNHHVQKFLNSNGFSVVIETDGNQATELIFRLKPILVILDIMLPGLDGLSICRKVRHSFNGPILILSSLADDIDQVAGLETGADAYLAKPVKPRVLLAHIRAILRRTSKPSKMADIGFYHLQLSNNSDNKLGKELLQIGRLKISASSRIVWFDGYQLSLTSGEFDLLWLLARHAGQIVSRDTLLRHVRGLEYDGMNRTVDQHISKIRKKIGDDANAAAIIKSVRGAGYILAA